MDDPSELNRRHDITFGTEPPGQVERACEFLSSLPGCKANCGSPANTLQVSYSLRDHTLEELESRLTGAGFRLNHGMLHNIGRKVVYYCEDTLRHNLDIPPYQTKQNEREVFVRAYDHEPHGDHDDTPTELRDYK